MNDICKQKIRERLVESLKKEGLPTIEAGGLLKINPSFLSCVKNTKLWYNVSEANWEKLLAWVNSGKGIVEYSKNEVRVASQSVATEENVQEVAIKKIAEIKEPYKTELEKVLPMMIPTPARDGLKVTDYVPKKTKSVPIPVETVPETTKPVLKHGFYGPNDLTELLKQEKTSLLEKLDPVIMKKLNAIDTLLNLYSE